MLTKNLDVSDELVNGVYGKIVSIQPNDPSTQQPNAIYVLFDDVQIGNKIKQSQTPAICTGDASIATPIRPNSHTFLHQSTNITRYQFPLKLAWAVTIHKVQGQTTKHAVISLVHIFQAGMAYVALSRVTSIDGLYLLNYNTKAFYCNPKIESSVCQMPVVQLAAENPFSESQNENDQITIIHHNIQSLNKHFADLKADTEFCWHMSFV